MQAGLDAERDVIKPQVLVCLGASAAQVLVGRSFRVTRDRGKLLASDLAPHVIATTHPAPILRALNAAARQTQREDFVRDLKKVAELLK